MSTIVFTCFMMGVVKEDLSSVGCIVSKQNSQAVVLSIIREGGSSDFDSFKWFSRWEKFEHC